MSSPFVAAPPASAETELTWMKQKEALVDAIVARDQAHQAKLLARSERLSAARGLINNEIGDRLRARLRVDSIIVTKDWTFESMTFRFRTNDSPAAAVVSVQKTIEEITETDLARIVDEAVERMTAPKDST